MDWKRIGKAVLFPPTALMVVLIPVSVIMLVGSMVFIGTNSPVSYVSYVISAYTLTAWCVKIPRIISFFKRFKSENKYARLWLDNAHLRVNVSLYGSLIGNAVYALFQLWLGFYHGSFWFYSMAGYYLSLAFMRFFLVRHTRKSSARENMYGELLKYRLCGWILLVMNITVSMIVFFMVYWNRTFQHHEITTIAMAAYTFTSFTTAIVNVVKYRKYNSPVYSASKAISFAAACVSMLTLESTMLTTFGAETMDMLSRRLFLGLSGGVICVFIVVMAVYMIVKGTKKLKIMKNEV